MSSEITCVERFQGEALCARPPAGLCARLCVHLLTSTDLSGDNAVGQNPEDKQVCGKGLPGTSGPLGWVRPPPARAVLLGPGRAPESELLKGT